MDGNCLKMSAKFALKMLLRSIFIWALTSLSTLTYAQPSSWRTQDIPMASQSQALWQSVVLQSWYQAIKAKSGLLYPFAMMNLQTLQQMASQSVIQFHYVSTNQAQSPWLLKLTFNDKSLDYWLDQYALPKWPNEHPSVTLWVSLQDQHSQQLVSQLPALSQCLEQSGKSRGLTIHIPAITSLIQTNQSAITQFKHFASHVTSQQGLVTGSCDQEDQQTTCSLRLMANGHDTQFQFVSHQPLCHQLVSQLIAHLQAPQNQSQSYQIWQVRITGINQLADVQQIQDLLNQLLNPIHIDMDAMDDQGLTFSIKSADSADMIQNQLLASPHFALDTHEQTTLTFQFKQSS
jgi:hypothetical protein